MEISIPHSQQISRTSIWKINKEIEDLNNTINQLELTDIYRTLYPTIAEYTFFSRAQGPFSRTDHQVLIYLKN